MEQRAESEQEGAAAAAAAAAQSGRSPAQRPISAAAGEGGPPNLSGRGQPHRATRLDPTGVRRGGPPRNQARRAGFHERGRGRGRRYPRRLSARLERAIPSPLRRRHRVRRRRARAGAPHHGPLRAEGPRPWVPLEGARRSRPPTLRVEADSAAKSCDRRVILDHTFDWFVVFLPTGV